MQKDHGDRKLAHVEREQVCDVGDAMLCIETGKSPREQAGRAVG